MKGIHSENNKLSYIYNILSGRVLSAVMNIPLAERNQITELRLRVNRPLSCNICSKEYYITSGGRLTVSDRDGIIISQEEIKGIFSKAFEHSLHSFHKELTQGYITINGGNRVGFCGTAVLSDDRQMRVENVRYISSLNIRIAREVPGCANELFSKVFKEGLSSLVIGGAPSSGKTTMLRDLCRLCADEYRVSLIDERNEISNTINGIAANDVGKKCDVFCSYNKADAIMTAVKVMTPQIVICDEVGTEDDLRALRFAVNSGVRLILTTHCSDIDELKKRPVICKLIKDKVLDHAAVLSGSLIGGNIKGIYKL
ncbi:MAG: stage III sporulation protein AA [Ruminococcus sp.]|nr:stage III sporulation protein AA [Ruminococcus sp.]